MHKNAYIHKYKSFIWRLEICFFFISSTCDRDMTAAIIKPITTIMSLAPNLFPPPLSVCNHRLPASALTDRPCGGCGHSEWLTWGAARLLHYPHLLPARSSGSFNPAPHTTDRHLCSSIQQQSLWPPKIELINTFSKYKWDDSLLMDCLSFGSVFKESVQ